MKQLASLLLLFVALAAPAEEHKISGRPARLGFVSGSVSMKLYGSEDWSLARSNRALAAGDEVWTDGASAAELIVASAVVRLSERTDVELLNLANGTTQLRLPAGSIRVAVEKLDEGEMLEVDTPAGAVSFRSAGRYRVEVGNEGVTVRVRNGTAAVTAGGAEFPIEEGQAAVVSGEPPIYDVVGDSRTGGWDEPGPAPALDLSLSTAPAPTAVVEVARPPSRVADKTVLTRAAPPRASTRTRPAATGTVTLEPMRDGLPVARRVEPSATVSEPKAEPYDAGKGGGHPKVSTGRAKKKKGKAGRGG